MWQPLPSAHRLPQEQFMQRNQKRPLPSRFTYLCQRPSQPNISRQVGALRIQASKRGQNCRPAKLTVGQNHVPKEGSDSSYPPIASRNRKSWKRWCNNRRRHWTGNGATGSLCLNSSEAVQEWAGRFLAGLASRKEEVRRCCRPSCNQGPRHF